eukprot:TRINITY_DN5580_c0_g1_i1.p1 TRINITY_DN5580_c0_g1~~TRINITY_DN5580_c0_g1_i1.p1  ORF type:complete len:116 (+),score=26.72 TRINITY_DN5580_c0_g1_i1:256-603(+)
MPLLKKLLYEPKNGIRPKLVADDTDLYVIRYTQEAFKDYSKYLTVLDEYRKRQWSCKFTGKSNLTYEEALKSESEVGEEIWKEFPGVFLESLCRMVHHCKKELSFDTNNFHFLST